MDKTLNDCTLPAGIRAAITEAGAEHLLDLPQDTNWAGFVAMVVSYCRKTPTVNRVRAAAKRLEKKMRSQTGVHFHCSGIDYRDDRPRIITDQCRPTAVDEFVLEYAQHVLGIVRSTGRWSSPYEPTVRAAGGSAETHTELRARAVGGAK